MEKETVRVIFKITPYTGDCIAFLPDALATPGAIMAYMHVGQHAEACKEYFYDCTHATLDESKELEEEIVKIYDAEVIRIKRLPSWWSWFDTGE